MPGFDQWEEHESGGAPDLENGRAACEVRLQIPHAAQAVGPIGTNVVIGTIPTSADSGAPRHEAPELRRIEACLFLRRQPRKQEAHITGRTVKEGALSALGAVHMTSDHRLPLGARATKGTIGG